MSESNQDAQHPATAIRLQQAARDGDAPKSYELIAAIQVTTGVAIMYFLADGLANAVSKFAADTWRPSGIASNSVVNRLNDNADVLGSDLIVTLLPILVAILICAILSHVVQSGTAFGFKKPIWQPKHLNPINGIRRLFSLDNLLRGIFGIPKVAIIGLVAIVVLWNQRFDLAQLQQSEVARLGDGILNQLFVVLFSVAGTLLAISLFDYLVQWYSFQTRMRMTDQQLRDENRLQMPDPQLKSRRIEFFEQISSPD